MDIEGKKIIVVGFGASGMAAAKLLSLKGAEVRITDEEDSDEIRANIKKSEAYITCYELGRHSESFCENADIIVMSPGIDTDSMFSRFAERNNIPIIGELELGCWFCPATIIAVTGTNGKSTTVELIGKILLSSGIHAVVCGNIGNPLSGEVEFLTDKSVAVVEVSSFQLETIKKFKPRIAVLLNIEEDHYDRHGTYQKYSDIKFRIFENQDHTDYAVLNSKFCDQKKSIKSSILYFGGENTAAYFNADGFLTVEGKGRAGRILNKDDIHLKGEHNLENIACSALVSSIMGVQDNIIAQSLKDFKGLEHRFEEVDVIKGVKCIDDSKATNVDATKRALESVSSKVVLIAGGRDKGGDYGVILPLVKEKVKAMVLIGEAREKIKNIFSEEIKVFFADNMEKAVRKSFELAGESETIMLSPMCSSFDMFKNYKERGEFFRRELQEYKKKNPL